MFSLNPLLSFYTTVTLPDTFPCLPLFPHSISSLLLFISSQQSFPHISFFLSSSFCRLLFFLLIISHLSQSFLLYLVPFSRSVFLHLPLTLCLNLPPSPAPSINLSLSLSHFRSHSLILTLSPGALQIERSEETDQGKYECVASNSQGVRYSSPANLYVRGTDNSRYPIGNPLSFKDQQESCPFFFQF